MNRRRTLSLSVILLLALGLRLAYGAAARNDPGSEGLPATDEAFAGSEGAPMYPWFLALAEKLPGEDLAWVLGVQALLSVLACWVLYEAGRRFGDAELGLAAAGLAAIYPPFLTGAARLEETTLDVLMASCLLWSVAAAWRHRDASTWIAVGWACGLMVLLRERFLLVLPFQVALTFSHGLRVGLRRSFGLVCGALMVLVPVAAHVYRLGGDPASIVVADDSRSTEVAGELGRFWTWSEPAVDDEQPLPRPLRLRFGTLCLLAFVGLWWLRRHFVHFLPVLVFLAAVTAATVPLESAAADREVVVPGLMLLAALPLRALWFAVRERRWWEVAALELLLVVALVVPWWI